MNYTAPMNWQVTTFCLGPWQTNCYLLTATGSSDCWLIDASFESEQLVEAITSRGLTLRRILLTHAHVDHIAGLSTLQAAWPEVAIDVHEAECDFLTDPTLNLSAWTESPIVGPSVEGRLSHGQILSFGKITFEVRHTPGHSPGGVTFYQPQSQVAFVGDTLFYDSIGRSDFPTSDGPTLMASIREQLCVLPDEVTIYPGHGPDSTIGRERSENPFLLSSSN